jgi:predicted HicB family RNase H-like nuclease
VHGVMRIHYEIDDELHRRAKAAAALRGQTLKEFVEESLEQLVKKAEAEQTKRP